MDFIVYGGPGYSFLFFLLYEFNKIKIFQDGEILVAIPTLNSSNCVYLTGLSFFPLLFNCMWQLLV